MEKEKLDQLLVIGAFGVIYIIWGSTYLVNYYAIEVIPPFLMCGTRFITAGLLLLGFTGIQGVSKPSRTQMRNAALMGILFLSLGTGGVVWAEQYVPTGITALIVAFDPLLVLFLLWTVRGLRPGPASLLGTALGIAGMVLLVGQPELITDQNTIWGLVSIAISLLAWGLASVYISTTDLPASRFQSTALQMIAGGLTLLMFSGISGEYKNFDLTQLTWKASLSWLYLVFLGSILAFSSFNYLLQKVSPAKVATATYVNPVVALFLGWSLNNEIITLQSLFAAGIMLLGVFFINR
ncbi:MAG: drug/metabolite exporter YedA [Saprospiraceae bacterium]|nr:MAG: drug/metabolite exporter YedA [Saprospiraceae bacterium]